MEPHLLNGHLVPLLGLREPVSALLHFAGALLGVLGGVLLWRKSRGDRVKQASMAIYAMCMVALFGASAAYHALDVSPEVLVVWRKIDHAAIFFLIAGTFTPFYVNAVDGAWRAATLGVIWSIALVGAGLKIAWIDMPDALSAGLYVGMGWLALIGYAKLAAILSHRAMASAAAGGVLYSLGAWIDTARAPVLWPGYFGFHEALHALVLIAAIVFWGVIWRWVAPFPRPDAAIAPARASIAPRVA